MFWLISFIVLLPFALVLMFGAPYLPTRRQQAIKALKLLDLKKGDLIIDLGCGDGAFMIEAAKQGYKTVGYELNPLIYLLARIRLAKYGARARVYRKNFWKAELPVGTKGVYVFLLDRYMERLDKKIKSFDKRLKLVSYGFKIPNKKVERSDGALFVYKY